MPAQNFGISEFIAGGHRGIRCFLFAESEYHKSFLAQALGQLAATRQNVRYFPSYELVLAAGAEAWEADGRHVRRVLVEEITAGFVASNFGP